MSNTARQSYLTQLYQFIETCFDREEFRLLCFELGVKSDNLRGETLTHQAMELVLWMERNGRLPELTKKLTHLRPRAELPVLSDQYSVISDQYLVVSQPISQSPNLQSPISNPFGITGKLQQDSHYFIRQPFTDQLLHELRKGASLSIVGESQTGKSSLLWHLCRPEVASFATDRLYVDMELLHSDDDFFEYICEELGVTAVRGFRLGRALKGRRVLLCLDEVEKMAWQGFSLHVRTELRGLADGTNTPFTLVIASRSPLGRLFPDSPEMTSPLAGLCTQLTLPPFTLAESHALVAQYLAGMGLTLPAPDIETAWQQSGGHPFRLQQALKAAFDRLWP